MHSGTFSKELPEEIRAFVDRLAVLTDFLVGRRSEQLSPIYGRHWPDANPFWLRGYSPGWDPVAHHYSFEEEARRLQDARPEERKTIAIAQMGYRLKALNSLLLRRQQLAHFKDVQREGDSIVSRLVKDSQMIPYGCRSTVELACMRFTLAMAAKTRDLNPDKIALSGHWDDFVHTLKAVYVDECLDQPKHRAAMADNRYVDSLERLELIVDLEMSEFQKRCLNLKDLCALLEHRLSVLLHGYGPTRYDARNLQNYALAGDHERFESLSKNMESARAKQYADWLELRMLLEQLNTAADELKASEEMHSRKTIDLEGQFFRSTESMVKACNRVVAMVLLRRCRRAVQKIEKESGSLQSRMSRFSGWKFCRDHIGSDQASGLDYTRETFAASR